MTVLDDGLIEAEAALNATPSVEAPAVLLDLFLDQQPGTLRTLH
jgi:hypothetical protein